MAESNHYDVIIIGSGAGGGTLALQARADGKENTRSSSAAATCRAKRTTGIRAR